jgi:hypothetical protein
MDKVKEIKMSKHALTNLHFKKHWSDYESLHKSCATLKISFEGTGIQM